MILVSKVLKKCTNIKLAEFNSTAAGTFRVFYFAQFLQAFKASLKTLLFGKPPLIQLG